MIGKYINGSIHEMLERARILKTKIPVNLHDSFHQLAANCGREIDGTIETLRKLLEDPRYQVEANLPRKVIDFQDEVKYMDYMENKIVAALNRVTCDDIRATKFIQVACKEINYPLLPPVVSRLSQEYYAIDGHFNHLRAPLLESEFFLHLPDIYHELCHSIIAAKDNPRIEKFLDYLARFIDEAERHCHEQMISYKRNDGAAEASMISVFHKSWVKWAIELFCDLFAIYTIGPAFAWANLHICIKKGGNPFLIPSEPSSHPCNHARMQVMLIGLRLIGFSTEAVMIGNYWNEFLALERSKKDGNFKLAYPDQLLELAATYALEGTKGINVKVIDGDDTDEIKSLLNMAWNKFIEDPITYLAWEKLKRETLRKNFE